MIYSLDELKRLVAPVAARYGLRAVFVFGSYATGTAREDSDVDLLVDTTGTNLSSLFTLGALYCDLEEALGKKRRFTDSVFAGTGTAHGKRSGV